MKSNMLTLTLLMIWLNWYASIPTMNEDLLPAYEPNEWGYEEVDITEEEAGWIWIGNNLE